MTKLFNEIAFKYETTFHLSGKVNHHNVQIWSSENPCNGVEFVRDFTPLNFYVWDYIKDRVFVPSLPASLHELQVRIKKLLQPLIMIRFIGFGIKSLTD